MRRARAGEAVHLAQGHLAGKAHLALMPRLSSIPLGWREKPWKSCQHFHSEILNTLTPQQLSVPCCRETMHHCLFHSPVTRAGEPLSRLPSPGSSPRRWGSHQFPPSSMEESSPFGARAPPPPFLAASAGVLCSLCLVFMIVR